MEVFEDHGVRYAVSDSGRIRIIPERRGHRWFFAEHPAPPAPRRSFRQRDESDPDALFDLTRRQRAIPLSKFPEDEREWIEELAAAPEPPCPWFPVGADGGRPMAWICSRAYYEWYWRRDLDPEKPLRAPMPRWLREHIIARDGYTFGICLTNVDPSDVHIDHIYPVSKGGDDHPDNLRVTHSLCNIRKGAKV